MGIKWTDIEPTTGKTYSELLQQGYNDAYNSEIKDGTVTFVKKPNMPAVYYNGFNEGKLYLLIHGKTK